MKLFPFQEEGVAKCLEFLKATGGVYLADEMGIGKSCQALHCVFNLVPAGHTNLIVCPSVMKYTWKQEILNWWPHKKFDPEINIFDKGSEIDKKFPDGDFVIVSYGLLVRSPKLLTAFLKESYASLILDESHMVKSDEAKQTIVCLEHLWPLAKYHICLSGTPFTQSVVDGFTLFNKLAPDLFPNLSDFVSKYAFEDKFPVRTKYGTKWISKYHGVKNADELSKLIRSRFFVRRRKDEVLKDLPPKIFTRISLGSEYTLKVPKDDKEVLEKSVKLIKDAVEKNLPIPAQPLSLASQRKAQGLKKLSAVIDFCKNLLDGGIPLVVFFYHRDCITQFTTELKSYAPFIITGDTPPKERASQVKDFQESTERNLFVLQIKAGGVGITLTRSSTVIFGEINYSPGDISQAADRTHRISQKNSVNVYYFVPFGSIDEALEETVIRKAENFNEVIG